MGNYSLDLCEPDPLLCVTQAKSCGISTYAKSLSSLCDGLMQEPCFQQLAGRAKTTALTNFPIPAVDTAAVQLCGTVDSAGPKLRRTNCSAFARKIAQRLHNSCAKLCKNCAVNSPIFNLLCKLCTIPRIALSILPLLCSVAALQPPTWAQGMAPSASAQAPPTATQVAAPKRMIIFDQDTAGPGGTDLMSLLVLLQDPNTEVLGVTVVQGDGWLSDEVLHALRLLEIVGRPDVPVAAGATRPLVRTLESSKQWEKKFGKVAYSGAWSTQTSGPLKSASLLKEGAPAIEPAPEQAGYFLARLVREHPHQVTIYEGGPMTNLARAIEIDPDFPSLTAGLVFMGGAVDPHSADPEIAGAPHREFNLWFDPDAAAIVFRAHWPSIICTTVDASIQTKFTSDMFNQIAASSTPAAKYIATYSKANESYMWDELAAAAWLDPATISRSIPVFMDVNFDTASPHYGDTLVYQQNQAHDPTLQPVTAQMDVDVPRFSQLFVKLMTASHTANTVRGSAQFLPSQR